MHLCQTGENRTMKELLTTLITCVGIFFAAAPPVSAGTVNLPQTGQTLCHHEDGSNWCESTGQDGEYKNGLPWPDPRFTVSGDCVTDNLTGLMWTKSANRFGLQNWSNALSSANGLSLCSYEDWRLPNMNELESLFHAGAASLYYGGSAAWLMSNGFESVQWGGYAEYWTSTTDASNVGNAWSVDILYGYIKSRYKQNTRYVWSVRGGQTGSYPALIWKTGQTTSYATGDDGNMQMGVSWPNQRFTVLFCNASGPCPNQLSDCDDEFENDVVTDNLTGLMWKKAASVYDSDLGVWTWEKYNWLTALGVGPVCGYTDWRLANRKELLSLVDRSRYSKALLSGNPFESYVASDNYYSSTSSSSAPNDYADCIDMSNGEVDACQKDVIVGWGGGYYRWVVRGGCSTMPVKINSPEAAYYRIMDAYNSGASPQSILARTITLEENLDFASNKTVNLRGGYNCDFNAKNGFTTINNGRMLIRGGSVTVENLIIK